MRLLLLAFLTAMASQAGPCVQATAACTERVPLGADGKYSVVYRTFPLTSRNDVAQRALVVVHGSDRNADHYFASGLAAAFLAGGLEDTIVLSPRFGSNDGKGCADRLAKGEISWDCAGDWKGGAEAINAPGRYSFDLLDAVLRHLADRSLFPNLRVIVVSGHSGGGQVTQRYAEVNKLHEGLA